jgi:hypothetical protein
MDNPISIGTGLLYKLTTDRDEMVEIIKQFDVDGIEFVLAYPEYVNEFKISLENISYLKNLKRVTVHAPWIGMDYCENENSYAVLEGLDKLYHKLNTKNINFDCAEISDYSVFIKYNYPISIENDDWRKKINTPAQIQKILKENPNLRFNFDFAHALTVNPNDIPIYLELFQDRITQIHLAYLDRDMTNHKFIHLAPKKERERIIDYLKQINSQTPIVLECVADSYDEVNLIKSEITFLRSIV